MFSLMRARLRTHVRTTPVSGTECTWRPPVKYHRPASWLSHRPLLTSSHNVTLTPGDQVRLQGMHDKYINKININTMVLLTINARWDEKNISKFMSGAS